MPMMTKSRVTVLNFLIFPLAGYMGIYDVCLVPLIPYVAIYDYSTVSFPFLFSPRPHEL